jgi:predicted HAD superfamily Cof-like phosphohydrolase
MGHRRIKSREFLQSLLLFAYLTQDVSGIKPDDVFARVLEKSVSAARAVFFPHP